MEVVTIIGYYILCDGKPIESSRNWFYTRQGDAKNRVNKLNSRSSSSYTYTPVYVKV